MQPPEIKKCMQARQAWRAVFESSAVAAHQALHCYSHRPAVADSGGALWARTLNSEVDFLGFSSKMFQKHFDKVEWHDLCLGATSEPTAVLELLANGIIQSQTFFIGIIGNL